jgi:aryl-alcohol dehydrogenase-like predicted oxidoreductase
VAKVIKNRRDQVIVATKGGLMGHHRDPEREPVYDRPEKVVAACEASLRRLETDYIDVYFCHIWWDKHEETEAFMRAFEQLKRDGKVRVVGVSTDNLDYIKHFNRDGGVDVVQVEYSILNRNAEHGILPYLQEHAIGAVIRGPLQKGLLTGKFTPETRFPDGDVRQNWPDEPWFQESLAKVERLRQLERPDQQLGQLALRFVLSHPAVTVAIPGAKTPAQVEANAAASVRPLLSQEELQLVDKIAPGAAAK